jgi:hypothetical protein
MGLLFGKKLSDGNVVSKKLVSDKDIDKKDIIKIGKTLRDRGLITRPEERRQVEEILNKAQSGGINKKEIHSELQKKVAEGTMSEKHASNIARELGLEEKRFRYFKDVSESKPPREVHDVAVDEKERDMNTRMLKGKLDSSRDPARTIPNLRSGTMVNNRPEVADNPAIKAKPTSIWSILNSRRN